MRAFCFAPVKINKLRNQIGKMGRTQRMRLSIRKQQHCHHLYNHNNYNNNHNTMTNEIVKFFFYVSLFLYFIILLSAHVKRIEI